MEKFYLFIYLESIANIKRRILKKTEQTYVISLEKNYLVLQFQYRYRKILMDDDTLDVCRLCHSLSLSFPQLLPGTVHPIEYYSLAPLFTQFTVLHLKSLYLYPSLILYPTYPLWFLAFANRASFSFVLMIFLG